jgi:hypothetical protein
MFAVSGPLALTYKIIARMKITCLAIISLSLFISCKKKAEGLALTPTKENLAGSYKTQKITASYSSTGFEADITNSVLPDSCERDDITQVNTDNTVNYIDAGIVCSPSNTRSSTWNLTSATTFDLDGESYSIRKWDGVNLEATYKYNSSTTAVLYLKKQ